MIFRESPLFFSIQFYLPVLYTASFIFSFIYFRCVPSFCLPIFAFQNALYSSSLGAPIPFFSSLYSTCPSSPVHELYVLLCFRVWPQNISFIGIIFSKPRLINHVDSILWHSRQCFLNGPLIFSTYVYFIHILKYIINLIILLLMYHIHKRVCATHSLKNNTKVNTCVLVTQIKNQNITNTLEISYMSLFLSLSPSSPTPACR